ncbi:MAG TPA: hypothetical protein VGW58_10360 [Pyrinomonadaceae bacterium]|nr:hypothetical protein [Pyrinomonadaceae bacterium]
MDTKRRRDEATSKETLEDLEDEEVSVDTDESDGPSPDGTFDEPDELRDADPT